MLVTDSIKPPCVSIVVPIYNSENTLKQCLDSLLSQTFSDIEIVCINDDSKDKSQKIIEEYMRKDSRVKLVTQKHSGRALTRNKGRYLARGEYIIFMDSDDYAKSDMIEKLYKNAKEYNSDIVLFSLTNWNSKTMEFLDEEYPLKEFSDDYDNRSFTPSETYNILFRVSPNPLNKMFRREFLEKKNIIFKKGVNYEEYLYFLQAYVYAQNISILRLPLLVHRINDKNIFKNDIKKLDIFKIMKLEKEFLVKNKLYKELKYQFKKAKRNILIDFYYSIKSHRIKLIYFWKLFFTYPFQRWENSNTK